MILLPTPGHTPGSISMLVGRPGHDPLLMVGDLTYDAAVMANDEKIPGVGSRRLLREPTDNALEMKRRMPDLKILSTLGQTVEATTGRASGHMPLMSS